MVYRAAQPLRVKQYPTDMAAASRYELAAVGDDYSPWH
jgi:hypothetical protein